MPNRILRDWTDSEVVNQLDAQSERLFTRLIMKADDFGRYSADVRLLKAHLFPFQVEITPGDIGRWLAECEKAGVIHCYSDDRGRKFLEIRNFKQRTRQTESKFPAPPDCQSQAVGGQLTVKRQSIAHGGGGVFVDVNEGGRGDVFRDVDENRGGDGDGKPSPPPPDIPFVEEVIAFGKETARIPEDYCRQYHAKTDEKHMWRTSHGRLIDWRKQIVRFWEEDRPTWGEKRQRTPEPAPIKKLLTAREAYQLDKR